MRKPDKTKNRSIVKRTYPSTVACGQASTNPAAWPVRTIRTANPLSPSSCGIYPGTKNDVATGVFPIVRGISSLPAEVFSMIRVKIQSGKTLQWASLKTGC